jgi:3-oxoacyl-[acyl-carrier protein] reductase
MKQVLVTGATRGLGLAIAERLAADGFRVVATGRGMTDALAELMEARPDSVTFEPHDLADTDGIHEFVNRVVRQESGLYGLVNNAALGLDGVLATMHNSDIERTMRINVIAPIVLAKYASRAMLRKREGRIVNISSIIASTGYSGLAAYGASKAAAEGLTRSLARELGKANITVNAVAPGFMATEMTSGLQGDKLDSIVRRSPLRRLATPQDAAGAVAWLMGPDGGSITGAIVRVDAGASA